MAATYAAMMQPSVAGSVSGMGQGPAMYDMSNMHQFGQRPGDYGRGPQVQGGLPIGFNFLDPSGAAAMSSFATSLDSLMAGNGAQQKHPSGGASQHQHNQQQPHDMANVASMLAMAAAASRGGPSASSSQQQLDHEQLLASLFAQPGGPGGGAGGGPFGMGMPGTFPQPVDVNTLAAFTAAAYGQQPGSMTGLSAAGLGGDGMTADHAGGALGTLPPIPGLGMSMGFRGMTGMPQGLGADAAAQFATAALQQQQGSAAAAAAMYAAILSGNSMDQYGAPAGPAEPGHARSSFPAFVSSGQKAVRSFRATPPDA